MKKYLFILQAGIISVGAAFAQPGFDKAQTFWQDRGTPASLDPVAIDAASNDLVMASAGHKDSLLKTAHAPGSDKFRDIYPDTDWNVQLDHAEKMGLGSKKDELVKI